MTKPDYITFSQEIFDECEGIRKRMLEDADFRHSTEFRTEAVRLADYFLSNEYHKYIESIQSK